MTVLPWFRPAVAVVLTALGVGFCVLDLFGMASMRALAMNSDQLVPISAAWDVLHEPHGLGHYEWPRIPSLLPDAVIELGAIGATGLNTLSVLAYAIAQLGLFVVAGGWIAARLLERRIANGVMTLLVLVTALALCELGWQQNVLFQRIVLPVIHFGPLVICLCGTWAVAAELYVARSSRGLAVIVTAAATAALSDRLTILEFVAPALLACAWARAVDGVGPRPILRVGAAVLGGFGTGQAAFGLIRLLLDLHIEPAPAITTLSALQSIRAFRHDTPLFIDANRIGFLTGVAVPLIGWAGFPLTWTGMSAASAKAARSCWIMATVAMAATVAFTAVCYVDPTSFRYAFAFWVWPLVFGSALLLRCLPASLPTAGAAVAVSCLAYVFVVPQRGTAPFLHWRHPLAACLRSLQGPLKLSAGLADYWVARPLMFSMDWSLQIDQLAGPAAAFGWLDDPRWYRHDIHHWAVPPSYNFIVLDRLDPRDVRTRFGEPGRVARCGGTDIWVYPTGADLEAKVVGSAPL